MVKEIPEWIMAVIMILLLLILLRNWRNFFFTKGNTRADTEPVPLLCVRRGTSIRRFAITYTSLIIIIGFIWNLMNYHPSLSMLNSALPLMPFILMTNFISAFEEEILFRASLISVSHKVIGEGQSLWMAALVFGSVHYFSGKPSMFLGFLFATIVGWGLGKVMLESKSIILPGILHFAINSASDIIQSLGTTVQ
jgi:membrane protease YdiL (CAAX protease family)